MSYSALLQVAKDSLDSKKNLNKHQINCYCNSLKKNPFLETLLQTYPLFQGAFDKLVVRSLIHYGDFQMAHDFLGQGQRSRIKKWLEKTYPPNNTQNVQDILREIGARIDIPQYHEILVVEENNRYKLRQETSQAHILPRNAQEAVADFQEYMEFLGEKFLRERISFARKELCSIWVWAQEDLDNRLEVVVRALDDARTSYHEFEYKFFEGKDYACYEGLQESLLAKMTESFHSDNSVPPTPEESLVQAFFDDFTALNATGGYNVTQALYGPYCEAMGAQKVSEEFVEYHILPEDSDEWGQQLRQYQNHFANKINEKFEELRQKKAELEGFTGTLQQKMSLRVKVNGLSLELKKYLNPSHDQLLSSEELKRILESDFRRDLQSVVQNDGYMTDEKKPFLEKVLVQQTSQRELMVLDESQQPPTSTEITEKLSNIAFLGIFHADMAMNLCGQNLALARENYGIQQMRALLDMSVPDVVQKSFDPSKAESVFSDYISHNIANNYSNKPYIPFIINKRDPIYFANLLNFYLSKIYLNEPQLEDLYIPAPEDVMLYCCSYIFNDIKARGRIAGHQRQLNIFLKTCAENGLYHVINEVLSRQSEPGLILSSEDINSLWNDAFSAGHIAVCDLLWSHPATLSKGVHFTAPISEFFKAVKHDHVEKVQACFDPLIILSFYSGDDLIGHIDVNNCYDDRGFRALDIAAGHGYVDMAHALIAQGANIQSYNKHEKTSLYYAIADGYEKVVDLFLEKFPQSCDYVSPDFTPLMVASQAGRLNLVKKFIHRGAPLDPDLYYSDEGENAEPYGDPDHYPLYLACESENKAVIAYLLEELERRKILSVRMLKEGAFKSISEESAPSLQAFFEFIDSTPERKLAYEQSFYENSADFLSHSGERGNKEVTTCLLEELEKRNILIVDMLKEGALKAISEKNPLSLHAFFEFVASTPQRNSAYEQCLRIDGSAAQNIIIITGERGNEVATNYFLKEFEQRNVLSPEMLKEGAYKAISEGNVPSLQVFVEFIYSTRQRQVFYANFADFLDYACARGNKSVTIYFLKELDKRNILSIEIFKKAAKKAFYEKNVASLQAFFEFVASTSQRNSFYGSHLRIDGSAAQNIIIITAERGSKEATTCFLKELEKRNALNFEMLKEGAFKAIAEGNVPSLQEFFEFVSSTPERKSAYEQSFYANAANFIEIGFNNRAQGALEYLIERMAIDRALAQKIMLLSVLNDKKTLLQKVVEKMSLSQEALKSFINLKYSNNASLLHAAAHNGRVEISEQLIDWGADIESRGAVGQTVLMCAVLARSLELVQILLKKGAMLSAQSHYNLEALDYACEFHQRPMSFPIACQLIQAGANPNKIADKTKNNTWLMEAILQENQELIEACLSHPEIDLNQQNSDGQTALFYAMATYNSNLVRYLVSKGMSLSAKDKEGKTPFIYAMSMRFFSLGAVAESNKQPELNTIITENPEILQQRDSQGRTGLMIALSNPRIISAETLAQPSNPLDQDNEGLTALFYSTKGNHTTVTQTLIKIRSDVNHKNKQGQTPLMFAVKYNGDAGHIRKLIKYGAQINVQDEWGQTALHIAASVRGAAAIKELLIRQDIDVTIRDHTGNTALHTAATNQYPAPLIALLKHEGFNIETKNHAGMTPLILASTLGCKNVVSELLRKEALLNAQDLDGRTALMMALCGEYHHVAEILLDRTISVEDQSQMFEARCHEGCSALEYAAQYANAKVIKKLFDKLFAHQESYKYASGINIENLRSAVSLNENKGALKAANAGIARCQEISMSVVSQTLLTFSGGSSSSSSARLSVSGTKRHSESPAPTPMKKKKDSPSP